MPADRVVALPRVLGRRIEGVPRDEQDFIPIDEHARVEGVEHVYAAGDVANFPFKHGGLAAQQADAAADAMLAELGLPIVPRPFDPGRPGRALHRWRAGLHAGLARARGRRRAVGPAGLFAVVAAEQDRRSPPVALPRHPRGRAAHPEIRPDSGAVAVSIDAREVDRSTRGPH